MTIEKCNFCKKPRNESFKLIHADGCHICDTCITSFNKLIAATQKSETSNKLNPIDIKKHLDKFIVGQETAKVALSVSITNHYKRMNYGQGKNITKSNLLISGPSGSGKTLLISTVAKLLDVPFVMIDTPSLTESGYIGENIDTIISRLLAESNNNVEAAQKGIVFLDEIDKLANGRSQSPTEFKRAGIQAALLKMVEGTIVRIQSPKKMNSTPIEVDTKNILFICGGAFSGMKEMVDFRNKEKSKIGFNDVNKLLNNSKEYSTEDFIQYGMIPEFIGRFPYKTHTEELSTAELELVLKNIDDNILDEFKFYFGTDDIAIEFTDDFIRGVAVKTSKEKTGVRGLKSILESIMSKHLFMMQNYKDNGTKRIIFNADTINGALPQFEILEKKISNK